MIIETLYGRELMTSQISDQPVSQVDQELLAEIRDLTHEIRRHQEMIAECSDERRQRILSLRRDRITYREMAAAMGVTEQSVYKILRDHIPPSPRRGSRNDPSVVGSGDSEAAGFEEGVHYPVGQGGDGGDGWQAPAGVAVFAG
jgi:hypothetical protein